MGAQITRGFVLVLILAIGLSPSTVAYGSSSRQLAPGALTILPGTLRITPPSPRIGEPATATFTVTNTSGEDALVPALLLVVRDLQSAVEDFHPDPELPANGPVATVTISPGGTRTYSVTRTFDRPGIHTAWPAYLDPASAELAPAERRWIPLAVDNGFPDDTVFPFVVRTDTGDDPVLIGAGDIAGCEQGFQDQATAALIEGTPGTVFTLGDNAYPDGSTADHACYAASWGRPSIKSRTFPAVGNHEYLTPDAAGYFDFFGMAAGPRGKGYYSYDLGAWHVIVLNSCQNSHGGHFCPPPAQDQLDWLDRDLAAHPAHCTLAYWHHAIFTSGLHLKDSDRDPTKHWMRPTWDLLQERGVDVVLNGHDHNYERFHRLHRNGEPDPANGMREFIVGTGGTGLREFLIVPDENPLSAYPKGAEIARSAVNGVLKLTLRPTEYAWEFLVSGQGAGTVLDPGSTPCH